MLKKSALFSVLGLFSYGFMTNAEAGKGRFFCYPIGENGERVEADLHLDEKFTKVDDDDSFIYDLKEVGTRGDKELFTFVHGSGSRITFNKTDLTVQISGYPGSPQNVLNGDRCFEWDGTNSRGSHGPVRIIRPPVFYFGEYQTFGPSTKNYQLKETRLRVDVMTHGTSTLALPGCNQGVAKAELPNFIPVPGFVFIPKRASSKVVSLPIEGHSVDFRPLEATVEETVAELSKKLPFYCKFNKKISLTARFEARFDDGQEDSGWSAPVSLVRDDKGYYFESAAASPSHAKIYLGSPDHSPQMREDFTASYPHGSSPVVEWPLEE